MTANIINTLSQIKDELEKDYLSEINDICSLTKIQALLESIDTKKQIGICSRRITTLSNQRLKLLALKKATNAKRIPISIVDIISGNYHTHDNTLFFSNDREVEIHHISLPTNNDLATNTILNKLDSHGIEYSLGMFNHIEVASLTVIPADILEIATATDICLTRTQITPKSRWTLEEATANFSNLPPEYINAFVSEHYFKDTLRQGKRPILKISIRER